MKTDKMDLGERVYFLKCDIKNAIRKIKKPLGMLPGDYGFWVTLARKITGSSGCVAGRWSWSKRK